MSRRHDPPELFWGLPRRAKVSRKSSSGPLHGAELTSWASSGLLHGAATSRKCSSGLLRHAKLSNDPSGVFCPVQKCPSSWRGTFAPRGIVEEGFPRTCARRGIVAQRRLLDLPWRKIDRQGRSPDHFPPQVPVQASGRTGMPSSAASIPLANAATHFKFAGCKICRLRSICPC